MNIRELDAVEFQSAFISPMCLQGEDEDGAINIKDYVVSCIRQHSLPATLDSIDISYVYISADEKYTHVMLSYGVAEQFLVVVTDNAAKTVFGHHLLNLNVLYGQKQDG